MDVIEWHLQKGGTESLNQQTGLFTYCQNTLSLSFSFSFSLFPLFFLTQYLLNNVSVFVSYFQHLQLFAIWPILTYFSISLYRCYLPCFFNILLNFTFSAATAFCIPKSQHCLFLFMSLVSILFLFPPLQID